MDKFLKDLCNNIREAAEATEEGTLVTIYKESGNSYFLAVGYKRNGKGVHEIFELHDRPSNPDLHGLFVAMTLFMGYAPLDIINHEEQIQKVFGAMKEYLPDAGILEEYTLEDVEDIFQSIKHAIPCLCNVEIYEDEGGD